MGGGQQIVKLSMSQIVLFWLKALHSSIQSVSNSQSITTANQTYQFEFIILCNIFNNFFHSLLKKRYANTQTCMPYYLKVRSDFYTIQQCCSLWNIKEDQKIKWKKKSCTWIIYIKCCGTQILEFLVGLQKQTKILKILNLSEFYTNNKHIN